MDDLLAVTGRAEIDHFWFHGFRAFLNPVVHEACRGRSSPRLVDCGCGTGHNMAWMQRHGRVLGFDLTAGGVSAARARGLTVAQGSVVALPFASNSFDVATCFDVLQLIDDDAAVVREMARVVRPGGTVILTAAAFNILRGGHAAAWPEVKRYTRASLRRLAEGAGLDVHRATYLFCSLFPLMVAVRALRRAMDDAGGDDWEMRPPPAPVNAVFTGMLRAEAAITRRWPIAPAGSSVLVVASKR